MNRKLLAAIVLAAPLAAAAQVSALFKDADLALGEKLIAESGITMRLTPPASAASHSPLRRLATARWTATSEDEQAVSSAMLGPCQP